MGSRGEIREGFDEGDEGVRMGGGGVIEAEGVERHEDCLQVGLSRGNTREE